MANFEAFRWNFSSSTNLKNGRSAVYSEVVCTCCVPRYVHRSTTNVLLHCMAYIVLRIWQSQFSIMQCHTIWVYCLLNCAKNGQLYARKKTLPLAQQCKPGSSSQMSKLAIFFVQKFCSKKCNPETTNHHKVYQQDQTMHSGLKIFMILVSLENVKKCVLGGCTITSKTKINVG